MNKSYDSVLENNEMICTDDDLVLINRYSRKELKAEDVFVFSAVLCDNEIDRDFERFSVESLKKLATLFVGKTAIKNHSMNCEDQAARTFKTEVIVDKENKNSLGEDYVYLKAYCYIPRIKKYESLIEEIEAGIKKEVSIGCSVEKSLCSICGADSRHTACRHIKGKNYNGKTCYRELQNPTDAYEWSFVAVPAQRNAGVVKNFTGKEENTTMNDIVKTIKESKSDISLTEKEVKAISEYIDTLEERANDGKQYREMLESETVKLFALSSPEISNDCTQSICKSLSTKDLKELNNALKKKQQTLSAPQLAHSEPKTDNKTNSQFRF